MRSLESRLQPVIVAITLRRDERPLESRLQPALIPARTLNSRENRAHDSPMPQASNTKARDDWLRLALAEGLFLP